MVSWANNSEVTNTSIWMGTPFFRQYEVIADFNGSEPMLFFNN